jgi:flagellar hook-associated protein 2
VAELFDRVLFNITDTFEGYVSFKQESLQTKIKGYGTQIDDMEARLERKREMLINQYAAMESAIQKIQSQSAWLTAQTQAAVNGWYRGSSNS